MAIATTAKGTASAICHPKLMVGQCVRGAVTRSDCIKPRCLYSQRALHLMNKPPAPVLVDKLLKKEKSAIVIQLEDMCRDYVKEQFAEAMANNQFLCGMQPFDSDHPLYGVIVARDTLESHDPVETEYYFKNNARWFEQNLCGYCANTMGHNGVVDEKLQLQWRTFLPLCVKPAVMQEHCLWSGMLKGTELQKLRKLQRMMLVRKKNFI